ncbi:hypothetical protein F5144DRAFT_19460 [Chaetomium tenue]|uniref:Uncharacterized protein n=1 Tax=Chaetomium tenue TaxID=1854479 RepID=A0ACB7PLI2_9PEZI|nr:hypothetical protein F5144DRAFT_19460 [Chaetomium globosum]
MENTKQAGGARSPSRSPERSLGAWTGIVYFVLNPSLDMSGGPRAAATRHSGISPRTIATQAQQAAARAQPRKHGAELRPRTVVADGLQSTLPLRNDEIHWRQSNVAVARCSRIDPSGTCVGDPEGRRHLECPGCSPTQPPATQNARSATASGREPYKMHYMSAQRQPFRQSNLCGTLAQSNDSSEQRTASVMAYDRAHIRLHPEERCVTSPSNRVFGCIFTTEVNRRNGQH